MGSYELGFVNLGSVGAVLPSWGHGTSVSMVVAKSVEHGSIQASSLHDSKAGMAV